MAKLELPKGQRRKSPVVRTAKKWTQAQVTALLGADATIESVAARTGHSVKAVQAKLARLRNSAEEAPGFASFAVDQISGLPKVDARAGSSAGKRHRKV